MDEIEKKEADNERYTMITKNDDKREGGREGGGSRM